MVSKGFDATEQRRARVSNALGIIKASSPLEYVKAVALISFNTGVSSDKAREYITILKDMGSIFVDQGMISTKPIPSKKGGK